MFIQTILHSQKNATHSRLLLRISFSRMTAAVNRTVPIDSNSITHYFYANAGCVFFLLWAIGLTVVVRQNTIKA